MLKQKQVTGLVKIAENRLRRVCRARRTSRVAGIIVPLYIIVLPLLGVLWQIAIGIFMPQAKLIEYNAKSGLAVSIMD